MEKEPSFQQLCREILFRQAFEELEPFKEPKLWSSLSGKERSLLAQLFTLKGERELNRGEDKMTESFDIAKKLVPDCSKTLYQQAMILTSQKQNVHCWNLAEQALAKAIKLNPHFFEAGYARGRILVNLGLFYKNSSYLAEADEVFRQASHDVIIEDSADFFRSWGLCLYYFGKQSGEPTEFIAALEKFCRAELSGATDTSFWNDYGNAFNELALLTDREDLFYKAVTLYQKAVTSNPSLYEGVFNMACGLERLYEINGNDDYFKYGDTLFSYAAKIKSNDGVLWLKWALLFVEDGKRHRNPESFLKSFDKFAKADECTPDDPVVLSRWGEARMLYGACTERPAFIRDGKEKLFKSLELMPESAEIRRLCGACLYELGHYFDDDRFYKQAIEKYRCALSLNRNDVLIWYGLALSHFAIGELNSDEPFIEKSVRLFEKADACNHNISQLRNDWGVALMRLAEITDRSDYIELAIDKFEKAIKNIDFDSESDEADPEWLYNYGCALDYLGEQKESPLYCRQAVQAFFLALLLDPSYSSCHYNLGLTYSRLGEMEDDEEYFRHSCSEFQVFLATESDDPTGWSEWGEVLIKWGLFCCDAAKFDEGHKFFAEAEVKLIQALALGGAYASYHLACLYSLTNNYPLSVRYLEKARQYHVLPTAEELLRDDWLADLRRTNVFRQFIDRLDHEVS